MVIQMSYWGQLRALTGTRHMQHRLLRVYAALHLAALYLASAAALPGLSPWLQPQRAQPLLQALGLWEPSIVACNAACAGASCAGEPLRKL